MNLFYTGLGIARSLGQRGISVVGLTAERGVYGNVSRYLDAFRCADSRKDPEILLGQLLELGQKLGRRSVIFPTRDHDLVFLDRFRAELDPYYIPVIPSAEVLRRCLDKWETFTWAVKAGVPTPQCWRVESADAMRTVAYQVTYPCVLKPVAAYHWRTADNWQAVGARKAFSVSSPEELLSEYAIVGRANPSVLVQEMVPGTDDCLVVAACYMGRDSRCHGGFTAQKLVQSPAGFGTGCIVQSTDRPELLERTIGLLQTLGFTGIAEVEYKWDSRDGEYKLIEINPRPWDQHRLGGALGVDLIDLAYRDAIGVPAPGASPRFTPIKWIAEDAFLLAALRCVWRRERGLGALLRQAQGRRVYAIWSSRDPLPFVVYATRLLPQLMRMAIRPARPVASQTPAAPEERVMRASQ